MNWAQIKDGIIQNVIVFDDLSLKEVFEKDYDYFINVSNMNPAPSPGWLYDGKIFSPPPEPTE